MNIHTPNNPTFQGDGETQHSPMNEPVSGDGEQLATFHIIEASRALTVFHRSKHSVCSPCKMNVVSLHTWFSGDDRH